MLLQRYHMRMPGKRASKLCNMLLDAYALRYQRIWFRESEGETNCLYIKHGYATYIHTHTVQNMDK